MAELAQNEFHAREAAVLGMLIEHVICERIEVRQGLLLDVIEILKKYASEEDAAFLNGVLGAVVKNEDVRKDSDAKEED